MQEHELTAWLGGIEITDEQRERMLAASVRIGDLYPDPDLKDLRESAFSAAAQVILGDSTLDELATAHTLAAATAAQARAALDGGVIAAAATMSEVDIAKIALSRPTVRKILGK